jgi:hypothetical protein
MRVPQLEDDSKQARDVRVKPFDQISTPTSAKESAPKIRGGSDTPLRHKSTSGNEFREPSRDQSINKRRSFPLSSQQNNAEELAIQRATSSLEARSRQVQKNLDTLRQAKQISTSTQDAELEDLIDKWRSASQAVAEELFGTVKERVCRMGGVAAWRETEKRKHNRHLDFAQQEPPDEADDDADCEFDSQGEELPEDEQEYRKKLKRQARQEMMEAADVDETPLEPDPNDAKPKVWQEDGAEDDVSIDDHHTGIIDNRVTAAAC